MSSPNYTIIHPKHLEKVRMITIGHLSGQQTYLHQCSGNSSSILLDQVHAAHCLLLVRSREKILVYKVHVTWIQGCRYGFTFSSLYFYWHPCCLWCIFLCCLLSPSPCVCVIHFILTWLIFLCVFNNYFNHKVSASTNHKQETWSGDMAIVTVLASFLMPVE